MKKSDLLFALLRKSVLMKEYVNNDYYRKFVVNLKYEYAKLQPSLRNMIRVMASDIDRFSTHNVDKSTFNSALMGENFNINGHPAIVDNITNNRYIVKQDTITCNGTVVFKDSEHSAFIVAFGCLVRAKKHQEKIMQQNKEEQIRLNILSEFL